MIKLRLVIERGEEKKEQCVWKDKLAISFSILIVAVKMNSIV